MITALFDKSFLQSLSVDESVWFDRHFAPVVCPVFYAETLADLAKEPTASGPAEKQVRTIAQKFPEMSGYPSASHLNMAVGDSCTQPSRWTVVSLLGADAMYDPVSAEGPCSMRRQKHLLSLDGSAASS